MVVGLVEAGRLYRVDARERRGAGLDEALGDVVNGTEEEAIERAEAEEATEE